jgi:hypothetical protein
MAIVMVSKVDHILHRRFVICRPGGHRGDTEWVVDRWRRLVAFMTALDLLHRAMRAVLHHLTAMAIEIASERGTFVCCHRPFFDQTQLKWPCYGPFKLMPSYFINLIGVMSLCVSYWPPPGTMDAVSATIVTSGRAQIRLNKRLA